MTSHGKKKHCNAQIGSVYTDLLKYKIYVLINSEMRTRDFSGQEFY